MARRYLRWLFLLLVAAGSECFDRDEISNEGSSSAPLTTTMPPPKKVNGTMITEFVRIGEEPPMYWSEDLSNADSPLFEKTKNIFEIQLTAIFKSAKVTLHSNVTVDSFKKKQQNSRASILPADDDTPTPTNNNYSINASYFADVDGSLSLDALNDEIQTAVREMRSDLEKIFGKNFVLVINGASSENQPRSWPDVGILIAICVTSVVGAVLLLLVVLFFFTALMKKPSRDHSKVESSHSSTSAPNNYDHCGTIMPNLVYDTLSPRSNTLSPMSPPPIVQISNEFQDNNVMMFPYSQNMSPQVTASEKDDRNECTNNGESEYTEVSF